MTINIFCLRTGGFRLTGSQNLISTKSAPEHRLLIQAILQQPSVAAEAQSSYRPAARGAALPTCSLAFAEAERYLPELLDRLNRVIRQQVLAQQNILRRMTGCPNACARPCLGRIGVVAGP